MIEARESGKHFKIQLLKLTKLFEKKKKKYFL